MILRLTELMDNGITVFYQSGENIREEYAAVGRNVMREARGVLHGKFFRMDHYCVIGSTNFTVSSRTNQECNTLIRLNAKGIEQFSQRISEIAADGMVQMDSYMLKLISESSHNTKNRHNSPRTHAANVLATAEAEAKMGPPSTVRVDMRGRYPVRP